MLFCSKIFISVLLTQITTPSDPEKLSDHLFCKNVLHLFLSSTRTPPFSSVSRNLFSSTTSWAARVEASSTFKSGVLVYGGELVWGHQAASPHHAQICFRGHAGNRRMEHHPEPAQQGQEGPMVDRPGAGGRGVAAALCRAAGRPVAATTLRRSWLTNRRSMGLGSEQGLE